MNINALDSITLKIIIVFTRESLAEEMQISYRKVIACMKELASYKLIWEKRCGRGAANQIYLALVSLSEPSAAGPQSAPFVSPDHEAAGVRSAESAGLDNAHEGGAQRPGQPDSPIRAAETALLNPRKTCWNSTSKGAETAGQEVRNPQSIKNELSDIDQSNTKTSLSVSSEQEQGRPPDGQADSTEMEQLRQILVNCALEYFPPSTAKVFENAIERLFFTAGYKIGGAILPRERVRSHLWELDHLKLREAERKLGQNTACQIKNSTAYTMAVVFNTIWEYESDLLLDPYLNRLKLPQRKPAGSWDYGGCSASVEGRW